MFKLILTLFTVDLLFGLVLEVQGGNEKCCICHKRFNKYSDCKLFVPSRVMSNISLRLSVSAQTHQEEVVPFVKLVNKHYINGKQSKPAHQVGLGSEMVPKLNFVVLSLSVLNISIPFF